MTDEWLIVKRGLYYRENDCGYTGIRDHAGRYSFEEAKARLSPGISMIRLDKAPSEACFEDLARAHLAKQRDEARAEIDTLREALRMIADDSDTNIEAQVFARGELRRSLLNHANET